MSKLANVYGVVTDSPTKPSKCIVAPGGEEETDIDPSMGIHVVVGRALSGATKTANSKISTATAKEHLFSDVIATEETFLSLAFFSSRFFSFIHYRPPLLNLLG